MKSAALRRFRDEQKAIAARITEQKTKFRQSQRDGDPIYTLSSGARYDSKDYRHRHIAYCLARGKAIEVIEKPNKGNEPDMKIVKGLLTKLREEMAQERQQEEQEAPVAVGE